MSGSRGLAKILLAVKPVECQHYMYDKCWRQTLHIAFALSLLAKPLPSGHLAPGRAIEASKDLEILAAFLMPLALFGRPLTRRLDQRLCFVGSTNT